MVKQEKKIATKRTKKFKKILEKGQIFGKNGRYKKVKKMVEKIR